MQAGYAGFVSSKWGQVDTGPDRQIVTHSAQGELSAALELDLFPGRYYLHNCRAAEI